PAALGGGPGGDSRRQRRAAVEPGLRGNTPLPSPPCTDWGHSLRVFGDMVNTFWVAEIDGRDEMSPEIDGPNAILRCRSKANGMGAKSFPEGEDVAFEEDLSFGLNLPDLVMTVVFDGRQAFGIRPRAKPIAAGRWHHSQSLMRALAVVDVSPDREAPLAIGKIGEGTRTEQLSLECAMEPFVLPLGLGVAGSSVVDRNSELPQPHRELHGFGRAAPGRPVVGHDGDRQSIPAKDGDELLPHGLASLIRTSLQSQAEPRMVI